MTATPDDGLPTLDAQTVKQIRADQIAQLYRFPFRVWGNALNAGVTAAMLWDAIPTYIMATWLGVMCAVTAGRHIIVLVYRRSAAATRGERRWADFMLFGSGATAVLWGSSSFVVWIGSDISYTVFVCFVVAGTTAAATMMSYPHLPSVYAFVLLAVGPLSANLFADGGGMQLAMGGMGLLFMALLVVQARVANATLFRALAVTEFNRRLVADLSVARDTLEARVRERTGELTEANKSLHDEIQARETTEAYLRQAQKLEAIGQLTAGIAHDFNNLLSVVLGNLDLALLQLKDRPKETVLLRRAVEAAERGASLTHRLLAFARRQTLVESIADMNLIIRGMTDLLSRTIGGSIDVTTKLARDLWPIKVDSGQFENAILILVINARDAMPEGGEIGIETENAYLDGAFCAPLPDVPPGDYVKIVVRDSGVGMSPEVMARAMEPFFTTKDVGKGTGLGLSMVYGFIKQSGGHFEIESEPGRGTRVTLYLPRAQEAATIEASNHLAQRGAPAPAESQLR